MFNNPAVFDLWCATVLTNNTKDCYCVANNRLFCHCIVAVSACCIVGTVDCENVAVSIGNFHVTVGCVVNFCDNTSYIVLVCCIGVVCHTCTKCNSFFDCKNVATYFVAWALVCASRVCAFCVKALSACWALAFANV